MKGNTLRKHVVSFFFNCDNTSIHNIGPSHLTYLPDQSNSLFELTLNLGTQLSHLTQRQVTLTQHSDLTKLEIRPGNLTWQPDLAT